MCGRGGTRPLPGEDGGVQGMERLSDASVPMAWLHGRPSEEGMTGFDATGWPTSTWVLHAMYENPALAGLGTQDELHRRGLTSGEVAPLIVGEVNLEGVSTVSGTPLGFMINPGLGWSRVPWAQYLRRFPDFSPRRDVPPEPVDTTRYAG